MTCLCEVVWIETERPKAEARPVEHCGAGGCRNNTEAEIQAVYALCYTIVAPTMQQLQRSQVLPPRLRAHDSNRSHGLTPHTVQSPSLLAHIRSASVREPTVPQVRKGRRVLSWPGHCTMSLGPTQVAPRRRSDCPQHSRRLRCRRGAAGAPSMDHMRMRSAHATTGILRWCGNYAFEMIGKSASSPSAAWLIMPRMPNIAARPLLRSALSLKAFTSGSS